MYEEYENTVYNIQGRIQIVLFDIETDKLSPIVEVLVVPADKLHKQLTHSDLEKI